MIKGLSERRRMPRAGKIKLGIQVTNAAGKTYPRAVDYFVCPPEVRLKHGEKPQSLPIMFPSDDLNAVFPQDYKMYKQSGLFCRGDGERAHRWDEGGNLAELACPCPFLESGECGPNATLNFFLPDVQGFGVYQIVTGSSRSIVSLNSSLESFSRVFGGLSGVRLILRLDPEQIQRFDETKRMMVKQTVNVLRLDCAQTIGQLIEVRARLTGIRPTPLPPAPETEAVAPVDAQPVTIEETALDNARETLWTLTLDAAGGDPKKALVFFRKMSRVNLKRECDSLADLTPEETRQLTVIMSRP